MTGLLHCLAAVLLFLQAGPSFGFSHPSILIPSPYTPSSSRRRAASNNEEPHSILRELSARVYRQRHQYARLDVEQATYADGERELPEAVHIILFRVDAPQRHVHTIDVGHQELMLAFMSGAECMEFARVLQDSELVDPSPVDKTSDIMRSKPNTRQESDDYQKRSASVCSTHTPQRHVHTIDVGHQERILAFESGAECAEFARMLRDLEFSDPSPVETMFAPFAQFCAVAGTAILIVPAGFGLTPPQINADDDGVEEDAFFINAGDCDTGGRKDAKDDAASARRKRWDFLDDDDDGLVAWG